MVLSTFDKTDSLTQSQGEQGSILLIDATEGAPLVIPGGGWLLAADFVRQGPDLLLVGTDGSKVLIRNYFNLENPPALVTETGALISAEQVATLSGPLAPGQVAQSAATGVAEPIGQVITASGTVEAVRADGTRVTLSEGDSVYQGDILETSDDGAVNIEFADASTFSLGQSGRMTLDEMIYDPGIQNGSFKISIVQGVFSFVSGQVAKTSPDAMVLNTPVATIGIRGTTVVGQANAEGSLNTITLLPDENGDIGEIVISNGANVLIVNLAGGTVTVASINKPISEAVVLSREQIQLIYGDTILAPLQNALQHVSITPDIGNEKSAEALVEKILGGLETEDTTLETASGEDEPVNSKPTGLQALIDAGELLLQKIDTQNSSNLPGSNPGPGPLPAPEPEPAPVYNPTPDPVPETAAAPAPTPVTVVGNVVDGYISGATVFADANNNGSLDPGEASDITDGSGAFSITGGTGPLVMIGGVDIATRLAFEGVMRAPVGSTVVTPLTTLLSALIDQGQTLADAKALVQQSLGLSPSTDITQTDPVAAVISGAPDGINLFGAGAQALNSVILGASLISGAGGGTIAQAMDAILAEFAARIIDSNGTVDFSNTAVMADVIVAASDDIVSLAAAQSTANIIQAINDAIDAVIETGGSISTLLTHITQVSIVAQSDAATALFEAAGNTAGLEASFTGPALSAAVAAAASRVGDVDGPGIDSTNAAPQILVHGNSDTDPDNEEGGTEVDYNYYSLFDGDLTNSNYYEGFEWDFYGNDLSGAGFFGEGYYGEGAGVSNGTYDAYDDGLLLYFMVDDQYEELFQTNAMYLQDDGRTLTTDPYYSESGIVARREFYVPDNQGFARFLETFTNTSDSEQTVRVLISTNLGSDSGTDLIGSSSGDTLFDSADNWLVSDDTGYYEDGNGDPAMTHVFQGSGNTLPIDASWDEYDTIGYTFTLTLAPGETRSLLHFAAQSQDQEDAIGKAEALANLELGALDGLSTQQMNQVANWDVGNIIVGSEDIPLLLGDLSISDADAGGQALTLTLSAASGTLNVASGSGLGSIAGAGTATLIITGSQAVINAALADFISYQPVSNFYGRVDLTVSVDDTSTNGGYSITTKTIQIDIAPVNDAAPDTAADTAVSSEDGAVTIAVLANDSDFDGDSLTVSAVTQGTNGTVSINDDYSVTYIPNQDFNGTDTFTYTASDGMGGETTETVSVTVNPVNDAPGITLNGSSGSLNIAVINGQPSATGADATAQLNDSSVYAFSADFFSSSDYTTAAQWSAVLANYDAVVIGGSGSGDGEYAAYNLYPALQDFVNNGGGVVTTGFYGHSIGSAGSYVSEAAYISPLAGYGYDYGYRDVTILDSTHPITQGISSYTLASGDSYAPTITNIDESAVVLGTLPNGTAIAYEIVGEANTVYLTGLYLGTSLGYVTTGLRTGVEDQLFEQAVAWAAKGGSLLTSEDTPLVLAGVAISDVDTSEGTYEVTLSVVEGVISISGSPDLDIISGDGTNSLVFSGTLAAINAALAANIAYEPGLNFNGDDTLTISVDDTATVGGGLVTTDTIAILVEPVNDAPVATDTTIITNGSSVQIPTWVLAGIASDVDGDALSVDTVSTGTEGASVSIDGDIYFGPSFQTESPAGTFSYTVTDGQDTSAPATVDFVFQSGYVATGTAGNDIIIGGYNGDDLFGLDGDDILIGNDGIDYLGGGLGADTLFGGQGADVFFYTSSADSGTTDSLRDVIGDFNAGGVDLIDIAAISRGTFDFLGNETYAFSGDGLNSEARFDDNTKILQIDADADGTAEIEITLTDVALASLDENDFSSQLLS